MSRPVHAVLVAISAAIALLVVAPQPTVAADNDIVLSRFSGDPTNRDEEPKFDQTSPDACGGSVCGQADPNRALFESMVKDLGQVMAPPLVAPSETLGQAGFAVSLVPSVSFIPSDEAHWQHGVEDEDPPSAMFVPNLTVRKGLPFSFEIAGTMSHISGSDMFTVGSHIKWALNEGFYLFPDFAVRGTVNTVVGSRDLQMITAGWDASISKAFPVAGVMSLTPYAGYQQLHTWGWSRLLNARPQDPRAPRNYDGGGRFNPEFVFSTHHEASNRFFLGTRFNIWRTSLVLEGVVGESVHQFNASVGLDF